MLKDDPNLSFEAYLWHLLYVPEKYLLVSGDGCRSVIIYQLIQRVELDHPEEILSSPISEHLEVLYIISKPGEGQRIHVRRGWRALSWLPSGHLPIKQDPWRPCVSATPFQAEETRTAAQLDSLVRPSIRMMTASDNRKNPRRTGSPINLILKTFVKKKKPHPTESFYVLWTVPNGKKELKSCVTSEDYKR